MRYIRSGVDLQPGQTVTLPDGSRMAWDNLALWSEAERVAIGITTAPDPAPPPPPPLTLAQKLAATDAGMARVTEDLAVAVLTGQPLDPAARAKINERRALRGLPQV